MATGVAVSTERDNTIKHKYQDKAQLLFTDTDSLCYHIKTDDLNSDRRDDLEK